MWHDAKIRQQFLAVVCGMYYHQSVDEEVHGTKRMKQSPSKLSAPGPSGHWNVANDMGTDDTTPSSPKFPSSSSSLGPLDDSSQEDGMDTEAAANKYSHCMKPGCSCRVDADDANLTGASFGLTPTMQT